LRFLSEIENGVYLDDPLENIHPDLLAHYHGTGGPHLSSEEQEDADEMHDLRDMIVADIEGNLNGEPVPVPKHANPFPPLEAEMIFCQALTDIQGSDIMPDSPHFPASQWNLSTYDTHENITVGFQKTRSLVVHLPPDATGFAMVSSTFCTTILIVRDLISQSNSTYCGLDISM
jgi:hypothetical protein